MKPDYGYFLFETTKSRGPHYFYDVLIYNIDQIDRTLYMSTANKNVNGVEYCISLDIPASLISNIVNKISNLDDKNSLSELIKKGAKFQYDFIIPFSLSSVACEIGDLYINQNEAFRPLIVTEID